MAIDYEIFVKGNSCSLPEGFIGLANLTLVHTGEGPMMFDVGHTVNRVGLVDGLAARGLRRSDVRRVFLSHLHIDHVMNIDLFPFSTRVYVSRADWEYAASPNPEDQFVPWLIREQLAKYDLVLLDGEGELEPGLRYLAVPGHTPGCLALDLDTADKGRVVIAGDAIKFPRELMTHRVDLAFDTPEHAARSIEAIKAIADRIVPGHFAEFIRRGDQFIWDDVAAVILRIR
jgi:N-acyl homoserine lactone hydrolase